ncbi:hypothetical protein FE257_000336 [Aspergillus nanangensis]|uniref:Uncharacterized protein n=1 Tax=Aspergillus nanangensis TaxID=2582783 RepID=A0AAD4CZ68_ASPNN|nr:hypothetical protein FE257_000336 [Aspergillus nanangensis]
MPRARHFLTTSDSETEYDESDLSMMEFPLRHTSVHRAHRRRSVSRPRHQEHTSTTLLSPIVQDIHLQRSSSTGARRRRDREERPPPPPAVIVDIKNDSRVRSSNKSRRQKQEFIDIESEDETVLRPSRRPRASTSISREASPRQSGREVDMLIDQRILEKNDARQDQELLRQQLEIDRLERELALQREQRQQHLIQAQQHHQHEQTRPVVIDDDWYEDEISDKLRRLDRLDREHRVKEEQRKAAQREKLRQWEEEQRRQQEEEEVRIKLREEKLKALQQKIDEDEERERLKKELRDEEARKAFERAEKEKKELLMKQAAIEEWKLNEERRKNAERELRKREDEKFRERLRLEFGYTEEEIEEFLKKKEKKEKGKEKEKGKDKKGDKDDDKDEHQTTWIKVHRKYLLPDTLIAYQLPWDWDESDGNYIVIKQWINQDLQDQLFAHTRRIREGKLVTQTATTQTELRVRDGKKDKLYLVRKKSPSRRAFLFT